MVENAATGVAGILPAIRRRDAFDTSGASRMPFFFPTPAAKWLIDSA